MCSLWDGVVVKTTKKKRWAACTYASPVGARTSRQRCRKKKAITARSIEREGRSAVVSLSHLYIASARRLAADDDFDCFFMRAQQSIERSWTRPNTSSVVWHWGGDDNDRRRRHLGHLFVLCSRPSTKYASVCLAPRQGKQNFHVNMIGRSVCLLVTRRLFAHNVRNLIDEGHEHMVRRSRARIVVSATLETDRQRDTLIGRGVEEGERRREINRSKLISDTHVLLDREE